MGSKLLSLFKITLPRKFLQDKNRNRSALRQLRDLGFSEPQIRRALLILNDVVMSDLADDTCSVSCISRTVKGESDSLGAQIRCARALRMDREDLFPPKVAA